MDGFYTVAVTICAAAITCALLSAFVTDGSIKRILSLVMGAFIVCSLIAPIKNAFSAISIDLENYPSSEQLSATYDEVMQTRILRQTKQNLELTLADLLKQNDITADSCEIIIAISEENRIIISSVCIYISEEYFDRTDDISQLVTQNFGIKPDIITE